MRNAKYGRTTQARAARSHARQRIGLSLLGFWYLVGAWLWSNANANAVWRMRAVCTGYRPAVRHRSVWAGVCTRWARVISLSGIEALGRANSCRARENVDAMLAILAEQAQATDLIVITQEAMSTVRGCRQGEAQQIIR